jgi:predicted metal-dependent HD superfamily phosphohydrolase
LALPLSLPAFHPVQNCEQARQLLRQLSHYYVGRAYHNDVHVQMMLHRLELEYAPYLLDEELSVLCYAILFHDIVYDAKRSDNEAASVALLATYLTGHCSLDRIAQISDLIQATAYYMDTTKASLFLSSPLYNIMANLDLSIFVVGKPVELEQFEAQIRQEYQHVAPDVYRVGRHAVLCNLEQFFLTVLDFTSSSLAVQNCRYLQQHVLHIYT